MIMFILNNNNKINDYVYTQKFHTIFFGIIVLETYK